MRKLKVLLGLCAALALIAPALPAAADPFVGPPICSSAGTALSGTYASLTVTGNAYVAKGTKLVVTGNLTLAKNSCLDAFTLGEVKVHGNVLVRKGAVLGLGCTPGSIGPVPPCGTHTTRDVVGGSVVADHAFTMYLDGDTIGGDVISIGGGPGPTLSPYINFPIKDNTIGGNVVVSGWKGAWFGALRNNVGGSMYITRDVGVTTGDSGAPDSTEIATNTIAGNLICRGNSPAAQLGDSGGTDNTVGGVKLGECSVL
jgi:hypothetical protein